jgi:hypothetical protein
MKININKKELLTLLLGLAMCSQAFAYGIYVHCTGASGSGYAQDHLGTNLKNNSVIQWIAGNPGLPNPNNGTSFLNGGNLLSNYNVGAGTGNADGTFDINQTTNQECYLRVWDGGLPARGKYYKTLGPYEPADPMPSDNFIATFKTSNYAGQPEKPKATATGFVLRYDGTNYVPSFNISVLNQASSLGDIEIAGNNIRIRKQGDSWDPTRTWAAASATIQEDPTKPYYSADGTTVYEVQGETWNYFGGNPPTDTDWGAIYPFTIPVTKIGGGTTVTHPYTFKEPASDSTVSPTSMCFGSISANINMASDLAKTINAANVGVSGFYVAAVYQENTGFFTYFDATGTPTAGTTDFQMVAREPVQVYTTKGGTITL